MNQRKLKTLEETMQTVILTPNSSVKSSIAVDCNPSETRDSSYYPGCKKDANCNCEICIASINATLDLMPQSNNRNSFKKFPTSKITTSRSPVFFNPDLTTPESSARTRVQTVSQPLGEVISYRKKEKRRKVELGYGFFVMRIFWGLILVFGLDYGISSMVSGVLQVRLSTDVVKKLGSKSRDFESLNARFLFLKNELVGLLGNEVLSCSSGEDSSWKINQDGALLHSRCVLYKSMIEEVSIWGWPMQTSGLLASEYSSRSFTVISGKVTEWSDGESKYLVRKGDNSSWAQGKWCASVVQLDPNTWILEYRRSFLVDNAKLVSTAMEVLKFRLRKEFTKMKCRFWVGSTLANQRLDYTRGRTPAPT